MKEVINRWFRLEEIDGDGRCPTYLYRWTIFRIGWLKVYLHKFVGDDWSLDLHDHPKRFVSIGLKGGYLERTPHGLSLYSAPWIRTFPAEHIHRISMTSNRPCWTIAITLKAVRPWGFWHEGQFVPWRKYVDSETADKMKACE
jgi:hypothetical protein